MDEFLENVGPERAWAATVVTLAVALIGGVLAFPQQVYVDFIWHYYWGPVYADAHGMSCVAWADGAQIPCNQAGADAGPTASPGYTFISYAGYIPTLILLLVGILFLIRRLEIERFRAGFYALFPFMLFGGALRVVEDANVAAPEMVLPFPWTGLIISPLIYFTVAFVALFALVASVFLERSGVVSKYEYPLFAMGATALAVAVGFLSYLAATESWVSFNWKILVLTLVGATVVTAITWVVIDRFAPQINEGTMYMGLVVIWAHAVDGVANVIGLEYAIYLGWESNLSPKHPINAAIVNYAGNPWPFLLVKILAAVAVVWVFDRTIFEDSPRFAIMLLITVVAVGLGPGTRDMLRATFGI